MDHQWYIEKAWQVITKDMANGLHQYDYWEQVPKYVQKLYTDKAKKDK